MAARTFSFPRGRSCGGDATACSGRSSCFASPRAHRGRPRRSRTERRVPPPPPVRRAAPPPALQRRQPRPSPIGGRRPTRSSAATRCMQIALDHGLDYRELAAWNNIENVNLIRVGPGAAADGAGDRVGAGAPRPRCRRPRSRPCRPLTTGRTPSAAPAAGSSGTSVRNTDNLQVAAEGLKEPYSEQALRDVQRGAASVAATPPAPEPIPPVVVARADPKPAPEPPPVVAAHRSQTRGGTRWRRQGRLGVAGEGQDRDRLLRSREPQGHRHRRHVAGSRWSRAPAARSSTRAPDLRGYGKLIIIKHNKHLPVGLCAQPARSS